MVGRRFDYLVGGGFDCSTRSKEGLDCSTLLKEHEKEHERELVTWSPLATVTLKPERGHIRTPVAATTSLAMKL